MSNETNHVRIEDTSGKNWVDTKLSDDSFKRVIGKNTLYVKEGEIVAKEKILPAKPFTSGKVDAVVTSSDSFMTIDIETVNIDGDLYPYLICGYSTKGYIHSYAADLSYEARVEMFTNFFIQMFENRKVKHVYAHNLSGFDGIFLLMQLIKNKDFTVKPIIFNGKIISLKVKYKNRTLIFKDSYLLLPISLRNLCKAFNVETPKGHFPFDLTDINYVGEIPDVDFFFLRGPNITAGEYNELTLSFVDKPWNYF